MNYDLISFDVDGTLECGGGPIKDEYVFDLFHSGVIVGITGNYMKFKKEYGEYFYQLSWAWGLVYTRIHHTTEGKALEKAKVMQIAKHAFGHPDSRCLHVGDLAVDGQAAVIADWDYMAPQQFLKEYLDA